MVLLRLGFFYMNTITNIFAWIKTDYQSDPARCVLEIIAWFMSVGANVLFMWTVPYVPFMWFLSLTVLSSAIFAWGTYSRKSFGMLSNYSLIVTLDAIALMKLLLQ